MVTNTSFNLIDRTGKTIITGHIMSSAQISWSDNSSSWNKIPDISKVYVIFMNHVDIGYDGINPSRGYVNNVINKYFTKFFPNAIQLAKEAEQEKLPFIYTTQPWLISLYLDCPSHMILNDIQLECPSKAEVTALAEAVKLGHLAMHAGALNMQYGMMNSDTVIASVQLAKQIYEQLGINHTPRVLSLRDVPGLTKNSLAALYSAGVRAISVGVNGGSAPPAVPRLFNWTDIGMLSMWHPGGYPLPHKDSITAPGGLAYKDCLLFPKQKTALAFAFRDDNQGPPETIDELQTIHTILQEEFPSADIIASSFDKFYEEVLIHVEDLQSFSSEIGDTWLQGIQSDPRKTAEYRAMEKAYSECVHIPNCNHQDHRVRNASRFMIKIAEHTWGLWGYPDGYDWSNEQFNKIRGNALYVEQSWIEQRTFINLTLEALGTHPLAKMMRDEIDQVKPYLGFLTGCEEVPLSNPIIDFNVSNSSMQVEFNGTHGFLSSLLMLDTKQWLIKDAPFGQVVYHTYNQTDFDKFTNQYGYYNNPGIDKPGSTEAANPDSRRWYTKPVKMYHCKPATFIVKMTMQDMKCHYYYGCPSQFIMNYTFTDSNNILMELLWINKTTTRLGEATMLNFYLNNPTDNITVLYDDDNEGSMFDVVLNGSQLQHGGQGIQTDQFTVYSHDVQLVCPILYPDEQATVFPVPLTPVKHATGVAFNLHNNIWSTNYVMWYADFKTRFTAKLSPLKQ